MQRSAGPRAQPLCLIFFFLILFLFAKLPVGFLVYKLHIVEEIVGSKRDLSNFQNALINKNPEELTVFMSFPRMFS